MKAKLSTILPGVRLSDSDSQLYQDALEVYSLIHSDYIRACVRMLVVHAEHRDALVWPFELNITPRQDHVPLRVLA